MEMTILPASWSAWAAAVATAASQTVASTTSVGVGGVVVAARLEPGDPVTPALPQLVDDLGRAFAVARPERHLVARRGQPGRDPPARRPGPPQHADVHAESFAQPTSIPHTRLPEHLEVSRAHVDGQLRDVRWA